MKIIIESPVKATIHGATEGKLSKLKDLFSYTNTSIVFQIGKIKQQRWFKKQNPVGWQKAIDDLTKQSKDCLLKNVDGEWTIKPGLISYIPYKYELVNKIKYKEYSPLEWKTPIKYELYPYQRESVDKLMNMSVRHGNVELSTGCGKSLILLTLCKEMGLNSVIITPSKSIFNELLVSFQKHLGKDVVGGYGDGKKDINKPITIAIGKSLTMLKKDTEAYEFFKSKDAFLVDESHVFASEQLNKICHGVLATIPQRIFVSATQTRNDGTKKLLESIIGETVVKLTIGDAIRGGYLCPLKFHIIKEFSPSTLKIKDPIKCKREHLLYNRNIAETIARISNLSWEKQQESTLILVEELRQIKMLTEMLTVPYAYVHSASKKEAGLWGLDKVKLQDQVDRFNNGEVKVLIGTKAIATGTNMFPTHKTINWVGGGSEIVTKQGAMGRSTRKLEISDYKEFHKEKKHTLIVDFFIEGQPMLNNQLKKRIGFYKESEGDITTNV